MRVIPKVLLGLTVGIGGSCFSGAALACPDFSINGEQRTYSSTELYSPVQHNLTAGGDEDLGECSNVPGSGWITRGPDFTFEFVRNMKPRRRLQFRTDGTCDTVLLVNTPSGEWSFNDDGGDGDGAIIDFSQAPEGIYDIWVGTFDDNPCSATLTAETFD